MLIGWWCVQYVLCGLCAFRVPDADVGFQGAKLLLYNILSEVPLEGALMPSHWQGLVPQTARADQGPLVDSLSVLTPCFPPPWISYSTRCNIFVLVQGP